LLSPAIQELKRRSPSTKIYVVDSDRNMNYFFKAERNLNGYSILPDYSAFKNNFNYNDEIILTNFFGFILTTGCKQHWGNLALKLFNVDKRNLKPKIYLSQNDEKFGRSYAKLLKNKMVVLCNDTSEMHKRWDVKRWEEVIKKCKGYAFVQVGPRSGRPIRGALNMLGRTTLAQAFSLVKYSKLVVAVDGLFNHVAHAFGIPKVILWSNSSPRNFGYNDNTINISKKIYCSPCRYLAKSPTRKCIIQCYVNKKVPQCMLAIKQLEVINAIKKMLNEKHDPNIKYYKFRPADKETCLDCRHNKICNIDWFKIRFSLLFNWQLI